MDFEGKLTCWIAPFQIDTCYDNGLVKARTIDESKTPLLVNGHRLKLCKHPLSKYEFT